MLPQRTRGRVIERRCFSMSILLLSIRIPFMQDVVEQDPEETWLCGNDKANTETSGLVPDWVVLWNTGRPFFFCFFRRFAEAPSITRDECGTESGQALGP